MPQVERDTMLPLALVLSTLVIPNPDHESGFALDRWRPEHGTNPDEVGLHLEGDIIVAPKNGLVRDTKRWPDAVLPYEIIGKFTNAERNVIARAMDEYHRRTCVRFRPRNKNDVDWIAVTSAKSGCWSSVGRVGGKQELNLQTPGCFGKSGTTVHEFLHACGFYHEQNRRNRDEHVTIHWENVDEEKRRNFEIVDEGLTTSFGVAYDYGSVMHYSKYAFSKNGNPTITPKNESATIGQREGFSDGDVKKLRAMYNCSDDNMNHVTEGLIDMHQNTNALGELISILFP